MNKVLQDVERFYLQMNDGDHIGEKPRMLAGDRAALKQNLLQEEVGEYVKATLDNNIVEVADALTDILYIWAGAVIEHGLQDRMQALFNEVQKSNMSKICKDSIEADQSKMYYDKDAIPTIIEPCEVNPKKYVIRRSSDGKILKNINYHRANLAPIVNAEVPDGVTVDDVMEQPRSLPRDKFLTIERTKSGDTFIVLQGKEMGDGVLLRSMVVDKNDTPTQSVSDRFIPNSEIVEDLDNSTYSIRSTFIQISSQPCQTTK